MPRRFVCRMCGCQAKLDQLTKGIFVIECKQCDIAEIFGEDQRQELGHFYDMARLKVAC